MGSGLIWAGLGKGIADAGSTYANAMGRGAELQWQAERELERENRLSEREIARDERLAARQEEADRRREERDAALQKLREESEERKAEALKQRVAKESVEVGQRADQIATERSGKAFDKLAESSALAGEQGDVALTKDQLRKLAQDDPALGKQYKEMGLIESSMPLSANQRRTQRAEDEATAALQLGAHSSVIEAYGKKRDAVLKEIAEENRDARERSEREMRDRQFQALLPIRQQQADAGTTRAGAAETAAGAAVTRAGAAETAAGAAVTRAGAAQTAAGAAVTRANRGDAGGSGASRDVVKLNQEAETLRKAAKDASSVEDRRKYEKRLQEVLDQIAARRQASSSSTNRAPAASSGSGNNAANRRPLTEFERR
jgi:hypothetical protein